MNRILAIDYGNKRVGIAVTDPCRIIVTPLQTVHSKDIFTFLFQYMQKENVEAIVIGIPKNLNGTVSDFEKIVRTFIKQVKQKFPTKKVFEYSERFTSKMATEALIYGGFSKKDRQNKSNIDMISAAIILQSFLDHCEINSKREQKS
jgi:putative Holliday junction resolvase